MSNPCNGNPVNPDISGIGVRLSFYLQNVLSVLLVTRSWEEAPATLWTFIMTSFGLTIAAIIQSKEKQLSFFQAVQVSNLVWMANFGLFLSLASYSRHRKNHEMELKYERNELESKENSGSEPSKPEKENPDNNVKYAATIQMFLSMGLTFYVWTHENSFSANGLQDPCVSTVDYIAFFAVRFPAQTSGKKLAIAVTSLLVFGYVAVTAYELLSLSRKKARRLAKQAKRQRREQEKRPENVPDIQVHTVPDQQAPDNALISTNQLAPSTSEDHSMLSADSTKVSRRRRGSPDDGKDSGCQDAKRQRRHEWSPNVDPMLVMISVLDAVIFLYFVVSNELLLTHNREADQSANQWAFGQILALIVIVPSVLSVINAFREHGFQRMHHRGSKRLGRSKHNAPVQA